MSYQREANMQQTLAQYMRVKYPSVIFRTDFAAGIKMTMGQAVKHKSMQHGRAYPDFFVARANRGYHGLFVELKAPGQKVYLKDGTISKERHIQEQAEVIQMLTNAGYYARFAVGIDRAIEIVDWYLDKWQDGQAPPRDNGTTSGDVDAKVF